MPPPQVQLAATRLRALGPDHPLLPALQLSLLNAANALSLRALTAPQSSGSDAGTTAAWELLMVEEELTAVAHNIVSAEASATPGSLAAAGARAAGAVCDDRACRVLFAFAGGQLQARGEHLRLAAAQHLHHWQCAGWLHSCPRGGLQRLSFEEGPGGSAAASGGVLGMRPSCAVALLHGPSSGTLKVLMMQSLALTLLRHQSVLQLSNVPTAPATGDQEEEGTAALAAAPVRCALLPADAALCLLQNAASAGSSPLMREAAQAALGALLAVAAGELLVPTAAAAAQAAAAVLPDGGWRWPMAAHDKAFGGISHHHRQQQQQHSQPHGLHHQHQRSLLGCGGEAQAAAVRILSSNWHPKLLCETLTRLCRVASALLHGSVAAAAALDQAGGGAGGAAGAGCGAATVLQQDRRQQWMLLSGDLLFATTLLQSVGAVAAAAHDSGPSTLEASSQASRRQGSSRCGGRAARDGGAGRAAAAPPHAKAAAASAEGLKAVAARALEQQPLIGLLCKAAAGLVDGGGFQSGSRAGGGAAQQRETGPGEGAAGADAGEWLGAYCSALLLGTLLQVGLLDGHASKALETLQNDVWERQQQFGFNFDCMGTPSLPAAAAGAVWGGPQGWEDAAGGGACSGGTSQWGQATAAAAGSLTPAGSFMFGQAGDDGMELGGAGGGSSRDGRRARWVWELQQLAGVEVVGSAVVALLRPQLMMVARLLAPEKEPVAQSRHGAWQQAAGVGGGGDGGGGTEGGYGGLAGCAISGWWGAGGSDGGCWGDGGGSRVGGGGRGGGGGKGRRGGAADELLCMLQRLIGAGR